MDVRTRDVTYHPDSDVGEDCDPADGDDEGGRVPALPPAAREESSSALKDIYFIPTANGGRKLVL